MNIEKMREEFEDWTGNRSDRGTYQRGPRAGMYTNPIMQGMWIAWQASRAAIEVELPSDVSGFDPSVCSMIDAIESLGLKVKS